MSIHAVSNEKRQTLNTLAEYIRSSEEELDIASFTRKRRKNSDKQWEKENVFENKESAEQAVKYGAFIIRM